MKLIKSVCCGNAQAEEFCREILGIVNVYDDLIDRDNPVSDDQIHRMMWAALVTLPRNAFYRQWFDVLNPVMMQAISNWRIANTMEADRENYQVAFVIRSSYVDIFCTVALLLGGTQHALTIGRQLREAVHSESFASYMEEMEAAHVH